MKRIRVALVDDHPVVLAGVSSLLRGAPDLELVGEAQTGADGISVAVEAGPDVLVVDISLPDISGVDVARQITASTSDAKVLALTVHEDRAYVQGLMQAGARGYVLKRSAAADLLRAIRIVAGGGVYLDPAVAEKALPAYDDPAGPGADTRQLSPREEAVLKLTAQGLANKEIARRLSKELSRRFTASNRSMDFGVPISRSASRIAAKAPSRIAPIPVGTRSEMISVPFR